MTRPGHAPDAGMTVPALGSLGRLGADRLTRTQPSRMLDQELKARRVLSGLGGDPWRQGEGSLTDAVVPP